MPLVNERDPQKRAPLVTEFQEIYDRNVLEIPLYFGNHEVIVPKGLELSVPASASPLSIWVETWTFTARP